MTEEKNAKSKTRPDPLSPKSVTDEDVVYFGEIRKKDLYKNVAKICTVVGLMVGLLFFIAGIVFIIMQQYSFNEYIPIAIFLFICCILTIIFCVLAYRSKKKKLMQMDIQQLGQDKLKLIFNGQKKSPNRVIDVPYYTTDKDIKVHGIKPSLYMLAGKFESIEAADLLLDEQAGKFAVCTLYEDDVILPRNVFETGKVFAVKLANNGRTVYETKTEDGFTRAVVGYALAGGVGALVGANTAPTNTMAHTIDDMQVIVTYNDLNRAYLNFTFGGNKIGAENLFQVFSVLCERNKKQN